MQDARLRGRHAIVGVSETAVGRLPDVTTLGLALEAARGAMSDAGLTPRDVDGVIADQPQNSPQRSYALTVAHAAGILPTFATDVAVGGASPATSVAVAIMAIDAGLCRTVLCLHAQKQATGRAEARRGSLSDGLEDYEEPFGVIGAPAQHATVAARHMHEFGTTSEQFAAVAVACRRHAALNPRATMREPITVADVIRSRWIVRPLHLLDCCLVSDGAGAVIVTTNERAASRARRPVYVLGFGTGHRPAPMEATTLTTLGGERASAVAYRMAGVRPADVDFAEIYDCFTPIVVVTLEDYGFCRKGEGGAFVEGGRIEIGGELPVNTHGGLLSYGHVEGMTHIVEAVRQLRGGEVEAERQVAGATVGIVSGHGANLSAHATLILSNERGG